MAENAETTTLRIWHASRVGNVSEVREALAAGGDPNAFHINEEVSLHIICSSLHIAVYYAHDHLLPILVAAGADVNLRIPKLPYNHEHEGFTPLMVALENQLGDGMKKRHAIVAKLVAAGAEVDALVPYACWEWTAFTFALHQGCRVSLLHLLRGGATIHRSVVGRVPSNEVSFRSPCNEDCFALLDKIDEAGGFDNFAKQRAVPVSILGKIFGAVLPHDAFGTIASFWMPRGGF